jgi:hypothetical protein
MTLLKCIAVLRQEVGDGIIDGGILPGEKLFLHFVFLSIMPLM